MTEQPFEAPLPRRAYFGAADKQHLSNKTISGGPSIHDLEIGRRSKLATTVTQRAEDVAGAVKALRAFDATGNTEDAINHLQAALQDLNKAHAIFVDDITESLGRYRDRRENETILAESTAGRRGTITEYIPPLGVLPDAARAEMIAAFGPERTIAALDLGHPGGPFVAAAPKPGPRA